MPASFGVTVDCAEPLVLARFWCGVLDYVEQAPPPGYDSWAEYDVDHGVSADEAEAGATIVDPAELGPRIYFQRVPETKASKNRIHLDVVAGPDWARVLAAVDAAVADGGRRLGESADPDDRFVVLADPEGNEFCLVPRL